MDDRKQRARTPIEGFGGDDWAGTVPDLTSPTYEETGPDRRIEAIEAVLEGLRACKAEFPDITGGGATHRVGRPTHRPRI